MPARALPSADPPLARWGRRALTLPLYPLLALVTVTTLPALLALAAIGDRVRGTPWALVRCVLFFAVYLLCEVVGLFGALLVWLEHVVTGRKDVRRFERRNFALQKRWASALFGAGRRIYSLDVEVKGSDVAARGPYLLLARHTSTADTVLPVVLVSVPHGIAMRYVLKRELLWDPCLDVVGNRLANAFVRRGSGDSETEIRQVQRLAKDLDERSAILIYPEGTRFTPAKRARILERLAASGDGRRLEEARSLGHVLPLRAGGTLGVLEAAGSLDVVVCAHVGFEGVRSFREFLDGGLVRARVRIRFWRFPAREIPSGREDRIEWLRCRWKEVDRWIADASRV